MVFEIIAAIMIASVLFSVFKPTGRCLDRQCRKNIYWWTKKRRTPDGFCLHRDCEVR